MHGAAISAAPVRRLECASMPGHPRSDVSRHPLRLIGWPYAGLPEDRGLGRAVRSAHPAGQTGPGQRAAPLRLRGRRCARMRRSRPNRCRNGSSRAFPAHERAAVGDWVLLEGQDSIVALLPRHTAIKRGAAGEHYQQQVIAANIDTVFIVCGLDADFNPRRIERYLLLVGGGGAEPVVVLTKADQTDYARRCGRGAGRTGRAGHPRVRGQRQGPGTAWRRCTAGWARAGPRCWSAPPARASPR